MASKDVDQRLARIQANQERINSRKPKQDEVDIRINQLKNMNGKLMGKMKELNIVLERALEKANQKKLAKLNKDGNSRIRDKSHQIQVK